MLWAGGLYAVAMFGLGFLLGAIRTLVLEPRIGPLAAVLVEAVPMLAAMTGLAPWAARAADVPRALGARIGMGLAALAMLLAVESLFDLVLRGRLLWAERVSTPDGLVGIALLLAFAAMPAIRRVA